MRQWSWVILLLGVLLSLALLPSLARGDGGDQLAHGEKVYNLRCITCHGDRGQGLTAWRPTWPPERQNCSIPKCHGLAHPPDGFYMPVDAPPIMGPTALARFETARDLFDFISVKMPFQEPGILSQDEYWALTAYMLQHQGVLKQELPVGPATASQILIHPERAGETSSANALQITWLTIPGILVVGSAAIAGALIWRRARRAKS